MALNLAKGGYQVYPIDKDPENIKKLVNENVKETRDIKHMLENC